MEQAKKDHYSTIYKHLPICDPSLGAYFLKEIQVHYDMNSEPEMLTEKFQMLTYSCVLAKQKFLWFKVWNEFVVLHESKKFPKPKFFSSQFNKWLHKATFWHKVFYFQMTFFHFFLTHSLFCSCSCSLRLRCSSSSMQLSLIFPWL